MSKECYTPEQLRVLRELQAKINLLERYITIAIDRAGMNIATDFADVMSFINMTAESVAHTTEREYNLNK